MLGLAEASERVLGGLAPTDQMDLVPLADALGRVLPAPVGSSIDLPPWDNAAMDGYAVRAADVRGASRERPVALRVVDSVPAGGESSYSLGPGDAIRIMTGAPVPDGADTVVRIEDTDAGRDVVKINDARDAGRNVRPRGEDVREGDIVVESGTVLGPASLGMLAAIGWSQIWVARIDGTGLRQLTHNPSGAAQFDGSSHPTWAR